MTDDQKLTELFKQFNDASFASGDASDRALLNLLFERRDTLPALDDKFMDGFKQGELGSQLDYINSAIYNLLVSSQDFWKCFDRVKRL